MLKDVLIDDRSVLYNTIAADAGALIKHLNVLQALVCLSLPV